MQPIEFVMEMAGISKVLGPDDLPTPTQWRRIHEMLAETMGPLVARKLFELGEEYEKQQKQKFEIYQELSKRYTPPPSVFGAPGVTYTTTSTTDMFVGVGTTSIK